MRVKDIEVGAVYVNKTGSLYRRVVSVSEDSVSFDERGLIGISTPDGTGTIQAKSFVRWAHRRIARAGEDVPPKEKRYKTFRTRSPLHYERTLHSFVLQESK